MSPAGPQSPLGKERGANGAKAIAAWAAAVVLFLILAARVPVDANDAARAGGVLGGYTSALLIAALLLWIVHKARGGAGARIWSPRLFVVAAVVGLVAGVARAGETNSALALLTGETDRPTMTEVRGVTVSGQSPQEQCLRGGLEARDEQTGKAAAFWRREGEADFRYYIQETCRRADERGLLGGSFQGSLNKRTMTDIAQEVLAEMVRTNRVANPATP